MRSRSCSSDAAGPEPPPAGSSLSSSDEDSPSGTSAPDSQTDLESLASWDLDSCSDQRGVLSLSQRVQVNRSILQQLLKNQALQADGDQSGPRGSGPHKHNVFVSSQLPRQQQQCEFRARMKRRCVPLRADHNLLTPAAQTLSGVRLRPVTQARSEGAPLSGHDSDSSSNESALGLTHRRLRFEDETETDVEFRYQERQRQRRRSAQQPSGVLASKPDLNLYIEGRAVNDAGRLDGRGINQCNTCGTILGDLDVRLHPPHSERRGPSQSRMNLWTEPIRETYIGSVKLPDTRRGALGVPKMKVKRRPKEPNGNLLPVNPYSSDPPSQAAPGHVPSLTYGVSRNRPSHQYQETLKRVPVPTQIFSKSEMTERSPGLDPSDCNTAHSERTGNQSPVVTTSDRQLEDLTVAELRDDTSHTPTFKSRDESSRLSLRRLFSNVTISRKRSNSLDHLTSPRRTSSPNCKEKAKPKKTQSNEAEEALVGSASRSGMKSPPLLKKSPSLQSLTVGSPFLQLRKSLSVQSFGSQQWRKKDRSENYKPATECILQRCLSVDDVGQPSSMRSVGRVLQVCSDGTFLIELCRASHEKFGFIISRGRGRPDSGVYVEDMVDTSTEKLYAGLLSVGDEIVEVNGEKVACLSLDEVTHLMTQNITTTVRVLRHWKPPSR
ncbi:uncharacterized protein ACB058_007155 [Synchiropus picturatus]